MSQGYLFGEDFVLEPDYLRTRQLRPAVAHVEAESQPRLARQAAAILARLKAGPATNDELARISLKYTSRISDLRQAGHDIRCVSQDRRTGVAVYQVGE